MSSGGNLLVSDTGCTAQSRSGETTSAAVLIAAVAKATGLTAHERLYPRDWIGRRASYHGPAGADATESIPT